jgi:uncharacterized protein YkwD
MLKKFSIMLCVSLVVVSPLGAVFTQLTPVEQTLLHLTNAERVKHKLPPLTANPILFSVARAHSANMARHGQMSHVLDGKSPFDRLNAAGYRYSWAGENVAYGYGAYANPATIFQGWMNSAGHRANILSPHYTKIGLGVAQDAQGRVYYTQLFARPL